MTTWIDRSRLRDAFLGLVLAATVGGAHLKSSGISLATVPMDPVALPESVLLFTGIWALVASVALLLTQGWNRALRVAIVSVVCFGLTFAASRTLHQPKRPVALRPANGNSNDASMSLVLGDVVVRVAPSKRYVLSVEGKEFLVLSLERSQLRVSGVMGANNRPLTEIQENTFPSSRPPSVRPARDSNTLLVQDDGKNLFEVRYAEPRRIEVTGQFFEKSTDPSALISCDEGITWAGGRISRGTTLDLTHQGEGSVDFGRSGDVRILPRT